MRKRESEMCGTGVTESGLKSVDKEGIYKEKSEEN